MHTKKLFYENSHLSHFTARVLRCTPEETGYAVILDATAFYPEGGGQACDTGTLGGVRVLDVQEQGETILHMCDSPLTVGETVEGTIDWNQRFERMQQHSGEHILSGVVHRRYGHHNTGFHMGSELITVDFDGSIPTEELDEIEAEVNRAVWANLPVRCWYPTPEELPTVSYRTKRALPWPVRIVEVPGFDKCACCGTHVDATGEIGLVKIFSAVPFRGGTRLEMACGNQAFQYLSRAFRQNRLVSQAFSAQIMETGDAAKRMNDQLAAEKYRVVGLQRRLFTGIANGYRNAGDVLHFEPDCDGALVRELADQIANLCGGTAAVFSGSDETGYQYCLISRTDNLVPLCKAMNAALSGRGGGKPNCQQGRIGAARTAIETFWLQK